MLSLNKKNITKERLDKFIANQMNMPREEAKEQIKRRVVTVNGVTAKLFDMKIDTENDIVSVMGEKIIYRKNIYIMMNKPQGVVCATTDRECKTVVDILPDHLKRKGIFPAGRLDKDTEGFVLLTDDGKLAHDILSPKKHVPKVYFARLEFEADDDYIEKFADGLFIDGGDQCLPSKLQITENKKEVLITLNEGMYHQVKRMFEAVGNKVLYLKRFRIGGVDLDEKLALGEAREMLHKEIDNLYTNFQ